MCAFAEFYGYTPDEFRALTVSDFNSLSEYRNSQIKRQNAANKKGSRGGR